MARRSESIFAFLALLLLLSLTLLYGCRAFDPQPPIINRAPETYIIGAPAETTGTGFRRHMYWYGTDVDGEVVQFIYAITDSTVRDLDDPQNRDEEDDRFNPAIDVTTLESEDGRFVGWTSKTDSVFLFTVDRGPTSSKDMTFHIVAVDDRGAVDRTPARLYFYNNSLGNPRLSFRLLADVGTGTDPVWETRWTGTYDGPDPSSPEASDIPYAGFERRFKIEWEASSPNGTIVGYRYRTEQGLGAFVPASIQGIKQWDPEATSFEFSNSTPPSSELGSDCGDDASGCDPALVRFPSGSYNLSVEAIDVALVETDVGTGELDFAVNYPPETRLVFDGEYPRYEVRDPSGVIRAEGPIAEGDTVPAKATVFLRSAGYDKFDFAVPTGVPTDSLCCDTPFNYDPNKNPGDVGYVPLVEYQSRLRTVRRKADDTTGGSGLDNLYSEAEQGDTISFWTGPLQYTYQSRTQDEHGRPDVSPEELRFYGGFRPHIRGDLTIPGGDEGGGEVADMLVVSLFGGDFTPNEIPYSIVQGETRWWVPDETAECGGELVELAEGDEPPTNGESVDGVVVQVAFTFVGEQDARDPLSPIRAWSYAIYSDKDPENVIEDGLESRDLTFFIDSAVPNEWTFGQDQTIDFFVPLPLAFATELYHPTSTEPKERSVGCLVARQMGNMTLELRGRTTPNFFDYKLYPGTRKDGSAAPTTIQLGEYGRQSPTHKVNFKFYVGGGISGTPTHLWPDF